MGKRALAALLSARGLPRHAAVHDIIAKTAPTMGPASAAPLPPSEVHSPLLSSSRRPSGAGLGSGRDAAAPACLCRGRWKRPAPLPNAAVGGRRPRWQSSAFRGDRSGSRAAERGGNPSMPHRAKGTRVARAVPAAHRFGVTEQPPILQDGMAGSTPKTGCVDSAGNRLPGKAPGKGRAAWDQGRGKGCRIAPTPPLTPTALESNARGGKHQEAVGTGQRKPPEC